MGPIGEENACHMMSNVQFEWLVTQLGDKPYTEMKNNGRKEYVYG